jgi:hypothetical protein
VAAVQASEATRRCADEHLDVPAAALRARRGVVHRNVIAHYDLQLSREQSQYRNVPAHFAPELPGLTSTDDTNVTARSSSKNAVYSTNDPLRVASFESPVAQRVTEDNEVVNPGGVIEVTEAGKPTW